MTESAVSPHTEYDSVLYPSALYPQTHPDRLATNAILLGLNPVPIGQARVLELGCGDGTNLIAMAEGLSGSQFLGIDLAGAPIRKGNALIADLELANVQLRQLDLLKTPDAIGHFDYILAHGLYSWVPEAVREKILSLCENNLSENGIAYVSYNAYPGGHLRDLVRHMMRFHGKQFTEPTDKIKQARALIKFAAQAKAKPGLWQDILSQQLERIGRYTDSGFFHDDLGEINQPFYFHEFMQAAARHGLQFLSEADFSDMAADGFIDPAIGMLNQLQGHDVVAREQYLDFLKGKGFRQTLLCRQELKIDRSRQPQRVFDLYVAGEVKAANPELDLSSPGSEDFHVPNGAMIATSHAVAKAALIHLGELFPASIHFDDLVTVARERCHKNPASDSNCEPDRKEFAEFLTRCHGLGFLELHSCADSFVTVPSEKPEASRLARTQLGHSGVIATMRHVPYKAEGELARTLLRSLDGTNDRPALLRILTGVIRTEAAKAGADASKTELAISGLPDELETQLKVLARAGLLKR